MTKKERKQLTEILETLNRRSDNYRRLSLAGGFSEAIKSENYSRAYSFSTSARFLSAFLDGKYEQLKDSL